MRQLDDYIGNLEVGRMQQHRNMALVPLIGRDSGLEYMVLDEALDAGLKISETRHVPELRVHNGTGSNVLLIMGEYVVGGWQNRMIAANALLARNYDGTVPVNCVQQHRWGGSGPELDIIRPRPPFIQTDGICTPKSAEPVFRSSERRASASLLAASEQSGQGGVWNEVSRLMASMDVESGTKNLNDVYDQKRADIKQYTDSFECVPGCVGMIVATPDCSGSTRYSMELFDQRSTMGKNFGKMVESYALEAIRADGTKRHTKAALTGFLDNLVSQLRQGNCEVESREPVSLGKDLKITGRGVSGYSLSYGENPVYTTFTTNNGVVQPYRPNTGWEPLRGRGAGFTPEGPFGLE
jgi:hypothetical protein